MAGNHFFVMQGWIVRATLHNKLQSNLLSRTWFKKYYDNQSGNISLVFDGSNKTLSVPWQDIINYSHIIMFFGKTFDKSCPWGPVFRFKTNPEYAHHVFCQFPSEYFWDLRASLQLLAAYKECLCNVYWALADLLSIERQMSIPNFNYEGAKTFFAKLDDICCHSFSYCFSNFNDYLMPIVQTSEFTNYLNVSKRIFVQQWAFLSSHRNINSDCNCENLTDFKERQVFITLLILQRMSNFRSLPYWCLFLSTAMYGWGTRDTVAGTCHFINGNNCLAQILGCFLLIAYKQHCQNSDPIIFKRDLWINGVRKFSMRQSVERATWW